MTPTRQGSIRLFRFAGIDLFLHWSWFLVAVYGISSRAAKYSSLVWPVLEYLALFLIVLLHEFGHALACRQVGGQADQIVLWPLGGVAYVSPPPRPGATLWSIAAGPLVNVVLAPVLTVVALLAYTSGWAETMPNACTFLKTICIVNYFLLIFNLLPVYPLDGGQILQSLLWFILGRARSLLVTTIIGFVGVAGLIALALLERKPLARHSVRLHFDQLLERADAGAAVGSHCQAPAPRRLCLPRMQTAAHHRPPLALRPMP